MFRWLKNSLLLCVCAWCATLAGQTPPVAIHLNHSNQIHFVAYGDTRFTNPADVNAANPEARRELVKAIARAHPEFITIGGDIAYNGNDPNDWTVYDSETAIWREKHIRVFPALGNHDLHGNLAISLSNYFKRYPELQQCRYYSVRTGNLLMLTLDSSLDETTGAQGDWLKSRISAITPEIDFVVIVLHHPPYTSSSDDRRFGGGHSARTPEQALAQFLEQRQKEMRARIVVLSGHVHNYEHHEHGGVVYFVTGGGGAHAYPIERRPTDLFQSMQINYHYIDIKVQPGKMVAVMNRLEFKNGIPTWTQVETVNIIVPAAASYRALPSNVHNAITPTTITMAPYSSSMIQVGTSQGLPRVRRCQT
jgi:Icc-related predicted phosphoesterase